jgi:hypothetical protein
LRRFCGREGEDVTQDEDRALARWEVLQARDQGEAQGFTSTANVFFESSAQGR